MDSKLTTTAIEGAIKEHLPSAKISKEQDSPEVIQVKATIQGPLNGKKLLAILETLGDVASLHSVYRSGTGLTLKFE